jgi:hypothetical protein
MKRYEKINLIIAGIDKLIDGLQAKRNAENYKGIDIAINKISDSRKSQEKNLALLNKYDRVIAAYNDDCLMLENILLEPDEQLLLIGWIRLMNEEG